MRRGMCILLSALLLLPLAACRGEGQTEGWAIYYAVGAEDGYGQAAVHSEVWTDAPEPCTAEDLFVRLLVPPEDDGLYSVFPEDVALLSWTLEDGLLGLDLSEPYGELSGISLTLANYCIVLTVSQLEEVSRVAITVEGQKLPEGEEGPFAPTDVLLSGEIRDPEAVTFCLTFPRLDGTGLETVERTAEMSNNSTAAMAEMVLRLLSEGSGQPDTLRDPFAGLESRPMAELMGEECLVLLPEEWVAVLTEDGEAQEALVQSLTALDGVETVSFGRIGGER